MDKPQADFFKAKILPIIREAGESRETNTEEVNPLRPMLRMLLVYIDHLEAAAAKPKQDIEDTGKAA